MNLMQGVAELIPHFGIKASCSQLNVPRASYNRWRAGRNSAPAARNNVRSRPPRSLDDSEIKRKPSVKRRDLQKNIVLTGNRTINF